MHNASLELTLVTVATGIVESPSAINAITLHAACLSSVGRQCTEQY